MIHIVIVDGQEEYKSYLCDFLSDQEDFNVAGTGNDSYAAIKLVNSLKPDILLLDMNLPQGDSIKTASLIKYRFPCTSVIINGDNKERRVFSVLISGVSGYITKQENSELLYHAIRTVFCGGNFVSPEFEAKFRTIASSMAGNILKSRGELRLTQCRRNENLNFRKISEESKEELPYSISTSDIQIMGFLGQGYTNKEIAEKLHLSEGTIRNHVSSVLQKTGFRDRTQAAIYAVKAGL